MIIEYDVDGRITHAISDPVAREVRDFYLANGAIDAPRGITMETHYVKDGAVVERPTLALGVKIDGRTVRLSGVPDDSKIVVEIEGEAIPATDTAIELDEPGPIAVIITPPWPTMEVRHDLEIK